MSAITEKSIYKPTKLTRITKRGCSDPIAIDFKRGDQKPRQYIAKKADLDRLDRCFNGKSQIDWHLSYENKFRNGGYVISWARRIGFEIGW